MKRGFRGAPRPLLPSMLLVATNPIAGHENAAVAPSQPLIYHLFIPSHTTIYPTPNSTSILHQHHILSLLQPTPPIPTPTPHLFITYLLHTTTPEADPTTDEDIYFEEQSQVHNHFSPFQKHALSHMPMDDLLQAVPNSQDGKEVLEGIMHQGGNLVLTDSEEEEPGRSREEKSDDLKILQYKEEGTKEEKRQSYPASKVNTEVALKEAIRLDSYNWKEEAKQIHLVALLAQRIDRNWDLIRAKLEANAELSKSMLGSELQGEDFARRMVDLVNQRKKFFAEERAKAKRNKPMTQSQLKTYMMNYLKNQGSWKLNQLRKLSFDEVKEEFDKLVKQIESFAPISFKATKDSLKIFGEELQTKSPKRLKEDKDDESKEDESTKKSGKRRKQMARKGMNTSVDESDSEDSDKVGKHEESNTGTETPINPIPVAMKTPSVATYKIIKQGEKGV
ncbi:hypothetical protein Tco_0336455 [Tanacetum coccineum]